jgi:hypothetical protein
LALSQPSPVLASSTILSLSIPMRRSISLSSSSHNSPLLSPSATSAALGLCFELRGTTDEQQRFLHCEPGVGTCMKRTFLVLNSNKTFTMRW